MRSFDIEKVYSTQLTDSVNALILLSTFQIMKLNTNRHLYKYININVKYKLKKIYILCFRLVTYVPLQRNKYDHTLRVNMTLNGMNL